MGRVRITRLFVLLALAALPAPRVEASRTSVWERNPHSSLTETKSDTASALASLAPAAAADIEAEAPPFFNLGDVVLVDTADADAEHFGLGPLTLVDRNLLRGPPPSYPETRVRGFELLPPFRTGASPLLSLWSRQACGFSCLGLASDSRYDPWGLASGPSFWDGVWSWLFGKAGWSGGTASPRTQETRQVQTEVPEISGDRFSGQPSNGAATLSFGIKGSSTQIAGVVTGVGLAVATEVAITYGEGKGIELVAKVGGRLVRRTYNSIKEAWAASREMGIANPTVIDRGGAAAARLGTKYDRASMITEAYEGNRRRAISRDVTCQYCQVKPATTADHVVSLYDADAAVGAGLLTKEEAAAAANELENLLGACVSCNSSKKSMLPGNIPGTWEPKNPSARAIELMKQLGSWR